MHFILNENYMHYLNLINESKNFKVFIYNVSLFIKLHN